MTSRVMLACYLGLVGAASAASIRVANPDLLKELSPPEQAILAKQGMVARTTNVEQMYDIYIEAADKKLPILVTTDPLFHVFHILYDYSLRAAELDFFYPEMEQVLDGLLAYEQASYAEEKNPVVKQALLGNMAYLSVPLSYLRSDFVVPEPASKLVQAERGLIERGEPGGSAVMGYKEDFSQYKPRGHYTRNERFRRYFKTMMYLGRMTFRLPTAKDTSLVPTRRAILLADAWNSARTDSGVPVKDLWQRVYDATVYMVGKSDDILPEQYYALARKLAGDLLLSSWTVSDGNLRRFVEATSAELDQPRILGDIVLSGNPAGMRLMGQRYVPDSHIFHNLTFDRIPGRMLPMGLDVMAVLGSERAREYLVNLYHQDTFPGYLARLDSMRAVFAAFDTTQWNQNAYYGWLYALRLNLEPVKTESRKSLLAPFVRSEAYPDKTLVSTSGSWAQLRHDTILYAKQSYTTAFECVMNEPSKRRPRVVAYVEPRPEVLGQLANLSKQLQDRLRLMGRLNEEVAFKLTRYAQIADRLAGIADEELAGGQMSESDVEFCRGVGGVLKSLTTFSQQFAETYLSESAQAESVTAPPQIRIDRKTGRVDTVMAVQRRRPAGSTYNEDRKMALVADVHTDPNSGCVLEVAVGNPMRMYAVVPCWGQNYLAVGACFSYYEFTQPMSRRMTDSEWQALSPKPPMPEWTRSFVVTE